MQPKDLSTAQFERKVLDIVPRIVGPEGPVGPTGPVAPTGATGPTGVTGVGGLPGSVWYTGSGPPSPDLGNVGDMYMNTDNGFIYLKTGVTTWTLQANITGPVGTTGPAGTPGSQIYSGTGPPSGGVGVIGDWYLNRSNGDVYQKTGVSTWTLRTNFTGPAGQVGGPSTILDYYLYPPAVIIGNTTTETPLVSLNMPGNTLPVPGVCEFKVWGVWNDSTTRVLDYFPRFSVYINGVLMFRTSRSQVPSISMDSPWYIDLLLMNTTSTTVRQELSGTVFVAAAGITGGGGWTTAQYNNPNNEHTFGHRTLDVNTTSVVTIQVNVENGYASPAYTTSLYFAMLWLYAQIT